MPKNLYIIGTMNTADKSIALIDIALRRRFVFDGMYPITSLAKPEWQDYLRTINDRILNSKGADFLIGHAYFMAKGENDLPFDRRMNQQVIPLLNEYFYNEGSDEVLGIVNAAKVDGFSFAKDAYKRIICTPTGANGTS